MQQSELVKEVNVINTNKCFHITFSVKYIRLFKQHNKLFPFGFVSLVFSYDLELDY